MTSLPQAIIDFFTSLVGILSSALGLVVLLLAYVLTNPEKVEKWQSILARVASYWSERAEKSSVSADIQAEINSFAKDMNNETLGAMPYGIRIEWTKETTKEALIQSGEVIVRMKHHRDRSRNMMYAALAYVSEGFLPHGRHYLEGTLAKSADHIMIRKIFVRRNLGDALHLYVSEFLEPETRKDSIIQHYCQIFERLDQEGFFTRIFAREIERLGLKLYPTIAGSDLLKETRDFVDFLKRVVEKPPGEIIRGGTLFVRPRFGTAIALIAKEEVLAKEGIGPHLLWISDCWEKGADTVYLCARRFINVQAARLIAKTLLETGSVEKLSDGEFKIYDPDGKAIQHMIAVLRRKGS